MNQCNRASELSLWGHVSNHKPVGGTGESAVGNQRHRAAKPGAHDRARYGEHFRHAWPSSRPFIANHHHVTRQHRFPLKGCKRVFLAVEAPRRPLKPFALLAGDLCDGTVWTDVSPQHLEMSGAL